MARKLKTPRERAARALCRHYGLPENARFEGRPMWESFLRQVDVVLLAALDQDQLRQVINQEKGELVIRAVASHRRNTH